MVLAKKYYMPGLLTGIYAFVLFLTGCEKTPKSNSIIRASTNVSNTSVQKVVISRWYKQEHVKRGYDIFQANCAVCHKPDASGNADWKKLDANDKLPPPPLNGTAHTWHHSLPILRRVVRKGGIPLGGSMPAFEDKLSAQNINDVLAWVQSNWSDEIYGHWYQRNKKS